MDNQRIFSTGATRDNADGKGRMDLVCWNAIIELSKHCERGAKHYGENNVRKGIPFHSLADSGARHLAKWIAGITDEPTHLVAACWNLMWLLEETLTRPELNDMWWNEQKEAETHSYCQDCAEIGTSECKLCNNGDRHSNMK